jgi:hypothetical protein
MARGWESKSIESQQEQAQESQRKPTRPLTPDELERRSIRRTLELARARAEADLARARNDNHRGMLERALSSIDERLVALRTPSPSSR